MSPWSCILNPKSPLPIMRAPKLRLAQSRHTSVPEKLESPIPDSFLVFRILGFGAPG